MVLNAANGCKRVEEVDAATVSTWLTRYSAVKITKYRYKLRYNFRNKTFQIHVDCTKKQTQKQRRERTSMRKHDVIHVEFITNAVPKNATQPNLLMMNVS